MPGHPFDPGFNLPAALLLASSCLVSSLSINTIYLTHVASLHVLLADDLFYTPPPINKSNFSFTQQRQQSLSNLQRCPVAMFSRIFLSHSDHSTVIHQIIVQPSKEIGHTIK
ncbi:uncharacterized protein [Rutidosis leptorrhynchoides]|uniref:uncharacterized protein n=1 Tax=Rutidosis leptorrhynchoides TaxID=125765 RepID=UPI003A99DF78